MRLNGGEFLLNLLVLGALTISSESVTITDESVIEQLTGLKNYINNERAIKPLFVKFNNGTEIVVAKGEVRKFIDDTDFILYARTKTSSVEINVSFTQRVNANEDPIDDYYIADGDATLTFTNEVQIFENIVDQDGHKRFFDIPYTPEEVENVSFTYSKASLSGTHLLIVLAGTISNGATISFSNFAYIPVEQWILDKLYPQYTDVLDTKQVNLYGSDGTIQTMAMYLTKQSGRLALISAGAGPLNMDRNFRLAFDLLIDNESSEDAGE